MNAELRLCIAISGNDVRLFDTVAPSRSASKRPMQASEVSGGLRQHHRHVELKRLRHRISPAWAMRPAQPR